MAEIGIERQVRAVLGRYIWPETFIMFIESLQTQSPKQALNAIKALLLVYMGKDVQGLELAYELISQKPTDIITLGNLDKVLVTANDYKASVTMFEEAFRMVSTEDIGALWFFSVLRTQETKSLFSIALKLHSMFKGVRYLFWAILALHIQTRSPAVTLSDEGKLDAEKSMKLAEKMVIKSFSPDKVSQRSLEEFLLLILTLQNTENHKDALDILDSINGISFPTQDEREILRSDLLEKNEKWDEAVDQVKEILARRGIFDWTVWKLYIKAVDKSSLRSDLIKVLGEFIESLAPQTDKRSFLLAKIDAGIVFGEEFCNAETLVEFVANYIQEFGDKGCCIPDMQHTSASLSVPVLENLVKLCSTKAVAGIENFKTGLPWSQLERIFRVRCISRGLDYKVFSAAESNIGTFESVLLSINEPSEALGNGWLHLATLYIDRNSDGDLLRAANCTAKAVKASPDNFSAKLFMILVYLKLGSVVLALEIFRSLDIKQLQLDTLAYLISDHLLELGDFKNAELFFHESFFIYDENRTQSWSLIAEAFSRGSYSNVPEFYEFARRLEYSLQAVACICGTIRTELLTKNLDTTATYLEGLKPDELLFDDEFMTNLSDNRDKDVIDFVDHAGIVKDRILNQLPTFGRTSILIYTFVPIFLRALLFDDSEQLGVLIKKFPENRKKIESHPVSPVESTRASFVESIVLIVARYIESEKEPSVMFDGLAELLTDSHKVESEQLPNYESLSSIEWELEREHWIVLTIAFLIRGKGLMRNKKQARSLANGVVEKLEKLSKARSDALGALLSNLPGFECPVSECGKVWGFIIQSFKQSIGSFQEISQNSLAAIREIRNLD